MAKQNPIEKDSEQLIIDYVQLKGSITNRECRRLLDSSYDETIRLLGKLTTAGKLNRVGQSSGTKYILPEVQID